MSASVVSAKRGVGRGKNPPRHGTSPSLPGDGLQALAAWAMPVVSCRVEYAIRGRAKHGSCMVPVRGISTVTVEPLPDAERVRRAIRTRVNKECHLDTWSGMTLLEHDAHGDVSTLLTHGSRPHSHGASTFLCGPPIPTWWSALGHAPDLRAFRTTLANGDRGGDVECVEWRRYLGRERIGALGTHWTTHKHGFMSSQTRRGEVLLHTEGVAWAHPSRGVLRMELEVSRGGASAPTAWNLALSAFRFDT